VFTRVWLGYQFETITLFLKVKTLQNVHMMSFRATQCLGGGHIRVCVEHVWMLGYCV
jgi:hypothetical protein